MGIAQIYELPPTELIGTLRDFAGIPNVTIEEPGAVAQAFDWAEAGMDFVDALHLAKAEGCDGFVTFDKALARYVGKLAKTPVEVL